MLPSILCLSLLVAFSIAGNVPTVKLSSGHDMPLVGLGTGTMVPWQVEKAVIEALENGYNFIDTAYVYKNEEQVGKALKKYFDRGGKREDLFISSKLPVFGYKPGDVEKFLTVSLKKLGLDYLDLYLIHHAVPVEPDDETGLTIKVVNGKYVKGPELDVKRVWKEMEDQVRAGRIRSIGVSNIHNDQMFDLYYNAEIKPANWQLEIHAYFQQKKLRRFAKAHNISVTAYSPLSSQAVSAGKFPIPLLKHPLIVSIAKYHEKTPAQVLLRHLVQDGLIVIPKSVHVSRMKENLDIFDFELSKQEMKQISKLDLGSKGRIWTFEGMFEYLAWQELNVVWDGVSPPPAMMKSAPEEADR